MKKDIEKIAKHFGLKNQQAKTIEECSELIQAISKLQRFDKCDNTLRCNYHDLYNDIYEELADVIIMLFQFIYKNKLSQENLLNEITKKLIRFYETKQE